MDSCCSSTHSALAYKLQPSLMGLISWLCSRSHHPSFLVLQLKLRSNSNSGPTQALV